MEKKVDQETNSYVQHQVFSYINSKLHDHLSPDVLSPDGLLS
jgi:hypothetical protein